MATWCGGRRPRRRLPRRSGFLPLQWRGCSSVLCWARPFSSISFTRPATAPAASCVRPPASPARSGCCQINPAHRRQIPSVSRGDGRASLSLRGGAALACFLRAMEASSTLLDWTGGAGMASTKLLIDDVSMKFATPAGVFHALDRISLVVPRGSFVSLIGPSGCGKSTIFNIVAGLQEPSAGRVLIDGVDATGTIGRVGYMLQKDL